MGAITERDYETMLDGVGRLFECDGLERFPFAALTEILRLVGADSSTFNYVAPLVPKVITAAMPALPDQGQRTRRFAAYLPQHSALNHFLTTGDPGAHKLSDFQSEREYHALPLYQEFYRELQYEDQFTVMLFPPGAELIGISLARNRRSFTERDRQILNLVRPQVARAYRHVERTGLLHRALAGRDHVAAATRVSSIHLDRQYRPVQFAPESRQWINHFFPERPRDHRRLPSTITDWLERRSARETRQSSRAGQGDALIREREGQRLRVSLFPEVSGTGRILVLGLETLRDQANSCQSHGLTRREIEVLLQVEHGKTNGEVAAGLGISALTVRCHLEHIFEKLRVSSRTAAVTRFRDLCGSVGQER
jgi:DNA-binding CsgD family transcriptional regulator